MSKGGTEKDKGFYQDVSRITLEGLAKITHEFDAFYKELSSKFQPALQGMTEKELPEASDQLNAIVESTEQATVKIMDVLEEMQSEEDKVREVLLALSNIDGLPEESKASIGKALESTDFCQSRIMNIFEELSFQDLTGQRIKRIVVLVQSVEEKLHTIISSLGQRLPEPEAEKVEQEISQEELLGPQRSGEGMDQSAIDALLADL